MNVRLLNSTFLRLKNRLSIASAAGMTETSTLLPAQPTTPGYQLATFAGGCFWGIEKFFKQQFQSGITNVAVGYTGGQQPCPTYKQVCNGTTGHAEAFRMEFDPQRVQYRDLVDYLFRIHDPTTPNRQGNDVGTQYRSAIFYHSPEQKAVAEQVRSRVQQERYPGQPISTEIVAAHEFYRAEEYHQRYLDLHPAGYCNHRLRW